MMNIMNKNNLTLQQMFNIKEIKHINDIMNENNDEIIIKLIHEKTYKKHSGVHKEQDKNTISKFTFEEKLEDGITKLTSQSSQLFGNKNIEYILINSKKKFEEYKKINNCKDKTIILKSNDNKIHIYVGMNNFLIKTDKEFNENKIIKDRQKELCLIHFKNIWNNYISNIINYKLNNKCDNVLDFIFNERLDFIKIYEKEDDKEFIKIVIIINETNPFYKCKGTVKKNGIIYKCDVLTIKIPREIHKNKNKKISFTLS